MRNTSISPQNEQLIRKGDRWATEGDVLYSLWLEGAVNLSAIESTTFICYEAAESIGQNGASDRVDGDGVYFYYDASRIHRCSRH